MTFEIAVWVIVGLLALVVIVGFSIWGFRPEAERFERTGLLVDQRGPDQRGPDQRGPDQRGPDQRGPDQRGPDQRGPDQPVISLRSGNDD